MTIQDTCSEAVLSAIIGTGQSVGSGRRFVIPRDPNELYQAVVSHPLGNIVVFNQLSAAPDTLAL